MRGPLRTAFFGSGSKRREERDGPSHLQISAAVVGAHLLKTFDKVLKPPKPLRPIRGARKRRVGGREARKDEVGDRWSQVIERMDCAGLRSVLVEINMSMNDLNRLLAPRVKLSEKRRT